MLPILKHAQSPPGHLAMRVLPYLFILFILPQIQGHKNITAKTIKRAGNELTDEKPYEELEIQQIMIEIIMQKFGVRVNKEDFVKILSKQKN